MKNQVIKNDRELRAVLKKSLEAACRDNEDCGSVKSNKERIASEIQHFMEYKKPTDYPVLLILDHTMHSIGLNGSNGDNSVFLSTSYQFLGKTELENHLRDIAVALNEITMETYPKSRRKKRSSWDMLPKV